MGHGYTYTTISARPGAATWVNTSFYLDEHTKIDVVGAGGDWAFLSIEHGHVTVGIGPRANVPLTDQDVSLIRRLAEKSARLLTEIERIHAEQQADHAAS